MLRRGEIPRANAELYLVTVTPHESIALYWIPPRRSSAQRHECSSKRLVRHSYHERSRRGRLVVVRENAQLPSLLRPNRWRDGQAGAKARALGLDRL